MSYRILVLGGYGLFGVRIARRLAREAGLHVIVAGRSADQANECVEALRKLPLTRAHVAALTCDAQADSLAATLKQHDVQLLIHCAGPFQGQNYAVAEAALRAGAHYIDL